MYKATLGALLLFFKDFCDRFDEKKLPASKKQELQSDLAREILQNNEEYRENIRAEELNSLLDMESLAGNREYYTTRYSIYGNDLAVRNALSTVMEYEYRMLREFA